MLEKTLALLARYAPGTFVPDSEPCYDEDEIEELGRYLSLLVYAPSQLRRRLQALGATITRSDFYSEIPDIAELERSFARPNRLTLDEPFRAAAFLQDYLQQLGRFAPEFAPPMDAMPPTFAWQNTAFSFSDAMTYYCMIRMHRPKTIVEMGCGVSTLVASLACEHNGMGRILAYEPFPAAFLRDVPHVAVIEKRAQDLDEDAINAHLDDGDIFFIDTTHTVKHDSDCLHIYLRILPRIASRVFVHVHDIHLPGPLPLHVMRDNQVFWNEQYLRYAYLLNNKRANVLYGSAYHMRANLDRLTSFMQGRYPPGGASFWFEQAAPTPPSASFTGIEEG